ncbi:uncharacterized protein EAE97_000294 [Botrytis byssoidea]|uniref:Uncharacterized protein n=1 Tax=Botrytis byssoidea TaxID=139641 RepID=A0A9P5M8P9_9HELO|nr:uncharacterized protein EAE97_000294 [Botrytis byssoidea]KAF7955035.1 hypothetical protein EAE97_000294 [Botrytis byssoidea]
MLPAISLQTSPSQQKDTSGSPLVSGPRELPPMPPSSTGVQCQTQVPTHFPLRQQTSQAQQSAATSNQFTRAGYLKYTILFAIAFPSWMNGLLKRFVKHLITWDKATIIAAVAIVVGTVISHFALKLAIWTATKDYIEYCQGEQCAMSKAATQGLPPPPFYRYEDGTILRRTWTGTVIGATESRTQNNYYIYGYALIASTMFYAAWNGKHSKLLRILRESLMPAQYDVERQPQDLSHCTKDTGSMDLAGEHAAAALPRRNSSSRLVTYITNSQDKMESHKLRQRTMRTTKKNESPTGKSSYEVHIEQDVRIEQLALEDFMFLENV